MDGRGMYVETEMGTDISSHREYEMDGRGGRMWAHHVQKRATVAADTA